MAVYVDNQRNVFKGLTMCHLLADTEEELHAMASRIGMVRRWFQNRRVPHYDICIWQKDLAVKEGAIEIDRRRIVELMHQCGWNRRNL